MEAQSEAGLLLAAEGSEEADGALAQSSNTGFNPLQAPGGARKMEILLGTALFVWFVCV